MARFKSFWSDLVTIMNIIIAAAVIIAAVIFKLRYRPEGSSASTLFGVCMFSALVMLLTVGSLSSFSGVMFYLAELVICSLVVMLYRREGRCQAAARVRRQAAARRAAEERAMAEARQRRVLSSYAAFTDVCGEAA